MSWWTTFISSLPPNPSTQPINIPRTLSHFHAFLTVPKLPKPNTKPTLIFCLYPPLSMKLNYPAVIQFPSQLIPCHNPPTISLLSFIPPCKSSRNYVISSPLTNSGVRSKRQLAKFEHMLPSHIRALNLASRTVDSLTPTVMDITPPGFSLRIRTDFERFLLEKKRVPTVMTGMDWGRSYGRES